ncbi:MAG: PspC domain-containing protein [candidate division Zixibacteria bacterium]|nr:PspC domain-containing protein [candidate division Zixibacteria bacterium]
MNEKLYRSTTDKFVGGVCGGLAEFFRIDPSIVRVVFVLLTLASAGTGIIAYLVMLIVIPKRPYGEETPATERTGWNSYLPGVILIGVGAVLLIVKVFQWIHWHMVWPVILILIGLALVFYNTGRSRKEQQVY